MGMINGIVNSWGKRAGWLVTWALSQGAWMLETESNVTANSCATQNKQRQSLLMDGPAGSEVSTTKR